MRPPVLLYLHNYVNPSGFSESHCRGTANELLEIFNVSWKPSSVCFCFSQVLGLLLSLGKTGGN